MKTGPWLIGVGAGIVSAILLATLASRSSFAFVLAMLSPLPLLIVGLGWHFSAALVGSVVAAIALGAVTAPALGVVYALGIGAPAAFLSYVALLGRPATESTDPAIQAQGGTEWYPTGLLVLWLAVLAACLGTLFVVQFGASLEAYLDGTRETTTASLRLLAQGGMLRLPEGEAFDQLVRTMSLLLPVVLSGLAFLVLVANLAAAARIVIMSGRSPRPWPDLAFLTLPTLTLPATAMAIALGAVAGGLVGEIARLFAATLLIAYVLQGLAVLHLLLRGVPARFLLLAIAYILLILGWASLPLIALGVLDPLLKLRSRTAQRRGPSA